MPSEAIPLGSVCSIKQGKYLAPTEMSDSPTSSSHVPVIGGNGVLGYTSRPSHSRDVVLVTCRGSRCGLLQWVKAPVWVSNNAMACDAGSDEANLLLRYALANVSFDDVITGSAQPQITVGHLSAKPISFPEQRDWRGIVGVLKSLDDRIDLLRRTNATLESIAQALFKSWFIDFDPVRAKAEGREPEGMDAATAALFPAEFEETEVGMLPKGWTAQPFGSLLAHAIGGDWGSETETSDCSLPATIIRGTDIPDIGAGRYHAVPRRFVSPKKAVKRILQDGDLAIEVSGGSKTQPTGRSLYLSRDLLAKLGDTVVPTSFCRLFRAKDSQTALVLARHLAHIYGLGKMWNYQVQSTGLANFQTQHFLDAEMVVVAPPAVFEKFFELVRPLVDRTHSAPIAELEAMRDALLPRLISGKLHLPEAQAQVDEAIA